MKSSTSTGFLAAAAAHGSGSSGESAAGSKSTPGSDTFSSRRLFAVAKALEFMARKTKRVDLQVQTVTTFIHIAIARELPMQDLEKRTGLSQAGVSRNVARLGNGLSVSEPGFGLVEAYEDPEYRRRKLVRLTARGKALALELGKEVE